VIFYSRLLDNEFFLFYSIDNNFTRVITGQQNIHVEFRLVIGDQNRSGTQPDDIDDFIPVHTVGD